MIENHLTEITRFPPEYLAIMQASDQIGFQYMCEPKTGALLRVLAATKQTGNFLEIGTGTGVSTAWIIDGASPNLKIESIESEPNYIEVAKRHLGHHGNLHLICTDAAEFIEKKAKKYDLIFADSMVGKFEFLEEVLDHLNVGGLYVIDDLLPQTTWPIGSHSEKVDELIQYLSNRSDLKVVPLDWASGLMVCVKTH